MKEIFEYINSLKGWPKSMMFSIFILTVLSSCISGMVLMANSKYIIGAPLLIFGLFIGLTVLHHEMEI